VSDGEWKMAFPGRARQKGPWILGEKKKGFSGAQGSRHLYNMQGGNVFEVDMLVMVKCSLEDQHQEKMLKLELPCLAQDCPTTTLFVPQDEVRLLAQALDNLPWSSLSWSMHRGMRDLLVAYGKPIMNQFRAEFAAAIKEEVEKCAIPLVKRGWQPDFVSGPMADMAHSAIMAGVGNSADLVRVVVAIVEALLEHAEPKRAVHQGRVYKDTTLFWRHLFGSAMSGESEGYKSFNGHTKLQYDSDLLTQIIALTKFFVLEWSQELDYQLYHDLPVELFMA